MQNKFKITDESGDHKYFTIIPNYIVNHSTPYEQSIYLYMKRVAGETGTCWSSAKTIAEQLQIARNTVAKYQQKLVDRGWIKVVGTKKTGITNQETLEYKIIDLWDINNKYYQNKTKSSTGEPFSPKEDRRVQLVNEKSSTGAHKEEHIKKKDNIPPNNNSNITKKENTDTQTLIDLYNSKFEKNTRPTPQKKTLIKRMLKSYTLEELKKAITICSQSRFHQGKNDRGWVADFNYIFRNEEQIDKMLNLNSEKYLTPDNKTFYDKQEWLAYMAKNNWTVQKKYALN